MTRLNTIDLEISYGKKVIVNNLNLTIPTGKITTLIGPNGCGKSTVLKTMSRILSPSNGFVYLDGKDIHKTGTKEIAKKLAILPQSPTAPGTLTVEELIGYGRSPHQSGFGKLSDEDKASINWAIEATNIEELVDREVDSLSGGQRQRVWIAMALAQNTDILLLDEPTTYLDLTHQLEVLLLLDKLNKKENKTIVMVIHDLNLASRFADHMVAIKEGKVVCEGTPFQVMTKENLEHVFEIDAEVSLDPRTRKPNYVTYDLVSNLQKQKAL